MSKQFQPYNRTNPSGGIQSELPVVRTFEIWESDGRHVGYEITHEQYPASTRGHEFTHLVFGKRARFAFVCDDNNISRADCIAFASAMVNGTYSVFHLDLKGISR